MLTVVLDVGAVPVQTVVYINECTAKSAWYRYIQQWQALKEVHIVENASVTHSFFLILALRLFTRGCYALVICNLWAKELPGVKGLQSVPYMYMEGPHNWD